MSALQKPANKANKLITVFSAGKDGWRTPRVLFDAYHKRFSFTVDAAADREGHLVVRWWGPGSPLATNALAISWDKERCWLNPPYSLVKEFVAKASEERAKGATVVMLIPSRTDTRWWHDHIWDERSHD